MPNSQEQDPGTTIGNSREQDLGTLIRLLNPYTDIMLYDDKTPPMVLNQVMVTALTNARALPDEETCKRVSCFNLEVDNRYGSQNGGNYLFWEFKGQPQTVKKAVRIEFRHPVHGVWITDHLLVGYAGSNGGG